MSGIDLYAQAVSLYQSGNFPAAAKLCQTLLGRAPSHLEALNLLAIVEAARGNPAESVKLTEKLLKKVPGSASSYVNLSGYFQQLGKFADALKAAERASSLAPTDPAAYAAQAACHRALGNQSQALAAHAKEGELAPSPLARMRLGDTFYHFAEYENAIAQYEQAILAAPHMLELRHNLSMALQRAGRAEEALAQNDLVVTHAPSLGEAHLTRGSIFQDLKRYDEALASYHEAITRAPHLFDAAHNLGGLLQLLGRAKEALTYCQTAISLKPYSATAHSTYANALLKLGRPEEALPIFDKAIALDPKSAAIQSDRANCLMRLGQYDAAANAYELAISHNPTLPNIFANRGWLNQQRGFYGDAMRDYDRALALDANHPSASFNKASHLLLHGEFAQGWEYYESRWQNGQSPRSLPMSAWQGEPLIGKTMLLHAEQGLGDTIQFCRYAKTLATRGARVILEVPKSLHRLMQTLEGPAAIITPGEPVEADYHAPLMSLPRILETDLVTIPGEVPYLRATPMALPPTTRPRIGLAWSGNATYFNDHHRSIPLALFAPLWGWDAEFHSLQPTVRESDRAALEQSPIHMHELNDMADTASLIAAMDRVITIDSAPAHLAGALARPVTVLLPLSPDFRWLLRRADSPWYPTATLARQQTIGDWQTVLEALSSQP